MKEHPEDKDSGTSGGRQLKKLGDLEDDNLEYQEEERRVTDTEKMEIEGKVKSQQRVCPICNRTFLSGKAFGGHMSSAHVQGKGNRKTKYCSQRSMKRKTSNKRGKPAGGCANLTDESDEDGEYYCSERLDRKMGFNKRKSGIGCRCCCCDKDFPSKKSLFGHMRCHPDRPYRGMDPPESEYNIKSSGNQENGVFANGKYDILNSGNPKNGVFAYCKYDIKNSGNQGNGVLRNDLMEAGTFANRPAKRGDLVQDLVGTSWFRKARSFPSSSSATSAVPMVEKSDSSGNNEMYDEDHSPEERCMANLLMHLHSSGGQICNLDDKRVIKREMGSATRKALPSEEGMGLFVDLAMSKKAAEETEQSSSEVGTKSAGMTDQLKNKTKCKAILENGKDDHSSDDTKTDDELVRKFNYARKGKVKIVEKKKKKTEYNNAEEIVIRKLRLKSSSARDASYNDISPHSVASVGAPPPPTPPQPSQHVAEIGKEFRCSYCGKIFTTHQALGGHKSSHNKFKMSIQNTKDHYVAPSAAMEDNNGDSEKLICDESPSSAKGKRSCKIRTKAVPSFQKMLDFDLNELPEEDC